MSSIIQQPSLEEMLERRAVYEALTESQRLYVPVWQHGVFTDNEPSFYLTKSSPTEWVLRLCVSDLVHFEGMKDWLEDQGAPLVDINPYEVIRNVTDNVLLRSTITDKQATYIKVRWGGTQ